MNNDVPRYTEADLRRIVSEKIMENRIEFIEKSVMDSQRANQESISRIESAVESMRSTSMQNLAQIKACRTELKEEIAKEFMTKPEGESLKNDVKMLNFRIMISSAAVVSVLSAIMVLLKIWDSGAHKIAQ